MLKRVEIKNIAQHKNTVFNAGERLTVISAGNGTGKTTFVNSFLHYDEELYDVQQLLSENSEIWVYDEKNHVSKFKRYPEKGSEVGEPLRIKGRSLYRPNFKIYNDLFFVETMRKHNNTEEIISINELKEDISRVEREIFLNEIKLKISSAFDNNENIDDDDFFKYVTCVKNELDKNYRFIKYSNFSRSMVYNFLRRINSYSAHTFSKEIRNYFFDDISLTLKKLNVNDFIKPANGSKIHSFSNNSITPEFIRFLAKTGNTEFISKISSDHSLSSTSDDKNISELDSMIKKFLFNKLEFSFRDDNSWFESEIKYRLMILNKKLKDLKINYSKNESKIRKISFAINDVIKNTMLFDKVIIHSDLRIEDKNEKKIILSTGELKLIDLIRFCEQCAWDNEDGKSVILLDDPLSSVDGYLADVFISYLKSKIQDKKHPLPQLIFLTHNSIVHNQLVHSFFEMKKETNDAVKFYKWKLDSSHNVSSIENDIKNTLINELYTTFTNVELSNRIRLQNARQIFEFIAFNISGTTSLSCILSEKCISLFHKDFSTSYELIKYLNRSSHFDYISLLAPDEFDKRSVLLIAEIDKIFKDMRIDKIVNIRGNYQIFHRG